MPLVVIWEYPGTGYPCQCWPNPAERREGESQEDFAHRIAKKDVPVIVTNPPPGVPPLLKPEDATKQGLAFTPIAYTVLDSASMPQSFRWDGIPNEAGGTPLVPSSWRLVGGKIVEDVNRARAQRRHEVLRERDKRLKAVRDAAAEADEDGDAPKKKAKQARAKALRNLEATVDAQLAAVADLATLDAWLPAELREVD
jgi:hypothetical protein